MQIQDNTETCYQRGSRRTRQKTSSQPSKSKSIHQRIKLEYINNKRPSKPSLPNVLEPSKLLLPIGFLEPCLLQLSPILQFSPIASANDWLLPMLPSNIKTSLDTQIRYGKCLSKQPLKDLEMERQELRKTSQVYLLGFSF